MTERWRRGIWVGVGALALVLLGCGPNTDDNRSPGPDRGPGAGWRSLDADEFLSSLEDRWLDEELVHVDFDVRSEGAFEADLQGELRSGEGDAVDLNAAGTFGPDSVTLSLSVRDGRMVGGSADRRFDEPVPAELHEALVIGVTRMGILHNLARLVSGVSPDRADGGVRAWVEARDLRWVTEDVEAGERGIAFEIRVEGEVAGAATLWLDAIGELVGRDQVVRFPGEDMRVRERYRIR